MRQPELAVCTKSIQLEGRIRRATPAGPGRERLGLSVAARMLLQAAEGADVGRVVHFSVSKSGV